MGHRRTRTVGPGVDRLRQERLHRPEASTSKTCNSASNCCGKTTVSSSGCQEKLTKHLQLQLPMQATQFSHFLR